MTPSRKACLLLAAALPLGAAHAHNYSYIEGGYIEREDNGGLRLAASLALDPRLAAFGEISDTDPVQTLSAGLMLHQPVNPQVDWTAGLSLETVDVGRRDDTGLGVRAGLRWRVPASPLVELNPEIRHRDVFDRGQTSLRVAALLALSAPWQLQIALQGGDEDSLSAGVRYHF